MVSFQSNGLQDVARNLAGCFTELLGDLVGQLDSDFNHFRVLLIFAADVPRDKLIVAQMPD